MTLNEQTNILDPQHNTVLQPLGPWTHRGHGVTGSRGQSDQTLKPCPRNPPDLQHFTLKITTLKNEYYQRYALNKSYSNYTNIKEKNHISKTNSFIKDQIKTNIKEKSNK